MIDRSKTLIEQLEHQAFPLAQLPLGKSACMSERLSRLVR